MKGFCGIMKEDGRSVTRLYQSLWCEGTSMWTTTKITVVLCLVFAAAGLAQDFEADKANEITFPVQEARFVRFLIHQSSQDQPCVDELEVYGPDDESNLALAQHGAKATASSCLPGYAIHQIAHLNDGLYGNDHSWIAAGTQNEWAQIELPRAVSVARVVFSRDREGRYDVRLTSEEAHRIKCWTDLNCPLWPDYIFRPDRLARKTTAK
jgi:hypothetical protein